MYGSLVFGKFGIPVVKRNSDAMNEKKKEK